MVSAAAHMARSRPRRTVSGIVLAGGSSTRFGSDKALAEWMGLPMASRPMRAMFGAGINRLAYVSPHPRAKDTFIMPVGAIGPEHLKDEYPGEGPLGAIVSALRHFERSDVSVGHDDIVVVASCDLPNVTSLVIASMLARCAVRDCDVVVPMCSDRRHWSLLAIRQSTSLPVLAAAFERGERAVHRAVKTLRIDDMTVDTQTVVNVNERTMLPSAVIDR